MDKHKMRKIIGALEAAQQRPGMYMSFGAKDPVTNWIEGFHCAINLMSEYPINRGMLVYQKIAEDWGWDWVAIPAEMDKRELSREERVDLLLTIEIAVWKTLLEQLNDADASVTYEPSRFDGKS